MLLIDYYYTTEDLLGLAYPDKPDADEVMQFFKAIYGSGDFPALAHKDDIFALFKNFLLLDNHIVAMSRKDSQDDPNLPANFNGYGGVMNVDNREIAEYYRNLYLFLTETAEPYSIKLKLYKEELEHVVDLPTSSSESKVGNSDMPITATFDAAPTSDVLSNLTQTSTTATAEATTPLERYEAAMNSIRSILKEWYDDYIRRFALYE